MKPYLKSLPRPPSLGCARMLPPTPVRRAYAVIVVQTYFGTRVYVGRGNTLAKKEHDAWECHPEEAQLWVQKALEERASGQKWKDVTFFRVEMFLRG